MQKAAALETYFIFHLVQATNVEVVAQMFGSPQSLSGSCR